MKTKSEASKTNSSLMKDINRIRKAAEKQARMNLLRKHQIRLFNEFFNKLIEQGRISLQELKPYMPKKKKVEKEIFGNGNNN